MSFSVEGAWTRQSVSVDGGEPFETQRVYWLQAGPCYADLRVPFHPSAGIGCFGGRSGWDGECYRWSHRLDLAGFDGDDVGSLTWDGERLIEWGVIGADRYAYEEVWVRLPGSEPRSSCETQEAPDGCHVQVGGHAITIVDDRPAGGSFRASYRVLGPDGWQTSAAIGDPEVGALNLCRVHSTNSAHLTEQPR